jgi:hypothetical protein
MFKSNLSVLPGEICRLRTLLHNINSTDFIQMNNFYSTCFSIAGYLSKRQQNNFWFCTLLLTLQQWTYISSERPPRPITCPESGRKAPPLTFIVIKGKGKVVPVLPLTEHHAMEAYWGSGGTDPRIL